MRNELNRHKRGDKIKWIITAICIVLLTVMVAGVCMQLFATDDKFKPSEWFKPSIKFVDVELSEYDKDDEGNLLETFTVLEPDEKGQVTLTYDSNRKLAKPIVSELDKAKIEYTIKIEFKSPTSEEFTEITLESYLEGNSGTYTFVIIFANANCGYKQSETSIVLVIEKKKVDIDWGPGGKTGTAFAVPETMYAKTASTVDTGIMPVYNFNMTESELKTITGNSTATFLSESELAAWQSILTVNNNITSETLNNFIFYYAYLPAPSVCILFQRSNVFESLSDFTLDKVLEYKNGSGAFTYGCSNEYSDYFYMICGTGRTPSTCNPVVNSIVLTYKYIDDRVPVPLPPDPVKEGHTFIGWYYDEEFYIPYNGGAIFEETKLYAKFEINTYTVNFNSDGGSTVASQTVNWNTSVTLSDVSRDGYIFKGWYMSDGTKYENQPIKNDITLIAHWEAMMCTVTFYVGEEVYTTKTVEYGTPLIKVVESAKELNLIVMAVRSASGNIDNANMPNAVVTDDSLEFVSEVFTGADKIINTVKNNKWQIVGGVVGGIALIAIIAAAVGGIKRKKR